MPVGRAGHRRARAREQPAEERPKGGLGTFGWLARVLSAFAAAVGLVWATLLFHGSQQLQAQELPSRQAAAAESRAVEAAVQPWRTRVDGLESEVSRLRGDLAKREITVARLTQQLEAKLTASRLTRQVDADAAADDPKEFHEAPPERGDFVHAPSPIVLETLERPLPEILPPSDRGMVQQTTLALLGAPSDDDAAPLHCTFKADIDYTGNGPEDMVEHISEQQCCNLCAKREREKPGSCAVGVMSSTVDIPPHACWLKADVRSAIPKLGVRACWPPGHKIPPDPAAQGDSTDEGRAQTLAALVEIPRGAAVNAQALRQRAEAVRNAMRHAWGNYKRFAWGRDELKPLSGKGVDTSFGHAVSMVDALDTLWIMGLKEEFAEAKDWVVKNLPGRIQRLGGRTSIFETTIRTLGGLLSAFDLSGDKAFLELATQLGRRISGSIDERGVVPYTFSGGNGGAHCRSLAESGTMQLEMRYLARASGDPSFAEKPNRFYETIRQQKSVDGLWPNCFLTGRGKITLGADGDSFYEYLVKVWLQGGQTDEGLWELYDAAAEGFEKHMVKKGEDSLTYVVYLNWDGHNVPKPVEEMEHLTCFVPGWLALGAMTSHGAEKRERRMALANSLAYTCWQFYERQPTGIGPERVKGMQMDLSRTDTREYILRPEALEGWWYMHQFTQDPRYRDWGWQVFQSFEQHLWVRSGYASLKDVRNKQKGFLDRMESFFFAETLKYLFLLQDPDNVITLDRYVLNTEGHPLTLLERPSAAPPAQPVVTKPPA